MRFLLKKGDNSVRPILLTGADELDKQLTVEENHGCSSHTKQCYHTRSTGQSSQLNIPICHRAVGQRSFSYRGVKLWSGISDNVKSTDPVNMFKKRLVKRHLSNQNRIGNNKFYFIQYIHFVVIIFMNYCY